MTALEREVLRRLPMTIEELRVALRVPRRLVEEAVENLRLSGEPIVGGNDGLRLATDPDELAAYVEARRRRAVTIYLGTRALRKKVSRMREARDSEASLTLWRVA